MSAHTRTDCDHPELPKLATVISGYRHCDLPDLSSDRFPASTTYSVSACIKESLISTQVDVLDARAPFAVLVATIGRVLGAYCGCTDVILALTDQDCEDLRTARITWDENTQWADLLHTVLQSLSGDTSFRITVPAIREALGLTEKQAPCLALVRDAPSSDYDNTDFPLVFNWDISTFTLRLFTSERHLHPSGADLLASQIASLLVPALTNPATQVFRLPDLQADLLSIYEKLTFEDRCQAYSRVPPVRLATDHLTLRLASQANDVAVEWYGALADDHHPGTSQPETMTFGEWHRRANQMARWLVARGLEKGDKVAVCMKRDTSYHVSLIAVLKAGACYVPIDPELPSERQSYIACDSGARFVLVSSETASTSIFGDIALEISSNEARRGIEAESDEELDLATPDDVSYLLYTSGTTGTPKGCVLTHRGLSEAVWALSAVCAEVDMEEGHMGNYLSIASVAFDVHLAEIFIPLARGMSIVSAPRSTLLEDLPYFIKELKISHLGIVPSLIEATMGSIQEDVESGGSTTLRYIASGGEKMSDAILDKWANHPTVRLANFYGPSEVTIGCAARFMDKTTPRANIGHPFASVSAFVVDENMNILLRGAPGELVVEGPLVGVGYHGRPDLTEKVFLEFPERGAGRWAYRTGDLVRMMPDGTLEVIGRIDTQIKLRGVRIESEGISSIVRSAGLPEHTLDVVTILGKHPAIGVEQLVSFIVWDQSTSVAVRKSTKPTVIAPSGNLLTKLSAACERELASYMRPSHFIPLNFMPLSSNGKNDAKLLTRVFQELDMDVLGSLMSRGSSTSVGSPNSGRTQLTKAEGQLLEIAKKHVHVPSGAANPNTNLFRYGLDSMSAVRLAAELRRTFSKVITASDILKSPSLEQIAKALDASSSSDQEQSPVESFVQRFSAERMQDVTEAYDSHVISAIYPPFPLQEGILYRSVNADTLYVQHVLLELAPGVSVDKLRQAWIDVVISSPILRTVFHFGRDLVQVVLHSDDVSRDIGEDVVHCDDAEAFKALFAERQSSVASKINQNVADTSPHRFTIYRSKDNGLVFVGLSIHHALFDGISLSHILRNLEKVYLDEPGYPSAAPEAVLDTIASVNVQTAQDFWVQHFAGFDWNRMPSRTASAKRADEKSLTFQIGLSELQRKASERRITLQSLLMTAFAHFLAKYMYGHNDVAFGIIRSGRSLPIADIETTVLPLLSVLPARVVLSASDVLRNVQTFNAEVTAYEHIPLGKIQQWVRPGANLFETLFSLSYKDDGRSSVWRLLESHNPEPDYILAVEVVLDTTEDRLTVQVAYTSQDLSSDIVDHLLDNFEGLALDLAQGSALNVETDSAAESGTALTSSEQTTQVTDIDAGEIDAVDEDLLLRLRKIVANFLQISVDLVTEGVSLVALGLDSIRSVGLSRVLRKEGIELASAEIMKLATPRRMAASAGKKISIPSTTKHKIDAYASSFARERDRIRAALDAASVSLSPDDEVDVFPVTTLQAGMLSQTVSSAGRRYVHLFPLRLTNGVDVAKLRDAWAKTVDALGILRTTFHFVPDLGIWTSAVHSKSPLKWSEIYLLEDASLLPLLDAVTITDAGCNSPPYQLYLVRSQEVDSQEDCRLIMVLHHALYDGVSISKLLDIVGASYNGENFHHGLVVPRLPDGSHSKKSHVASSVLNVSRSEVEKVCRLTAVTTQCVGQYAFAKLLASLTRSTDILFGHVVSGRNVSGAEDVIGPVLNTVPCRVRFASSVSNKLLLQAIHDTNVTALSWQHASLRSIQSHLKVERLWDCLFVFQPSQATETSEHKSVWEFDEVEDEDIDIQYGFNLELHETAAGFLLKAACSDRLMDAEDLGAALERFGLFLRVLVDDLDASCLNGLPDLTAPTTPHSVSESDFETDQIVSSWDEKSSTLRELLSTATGIPSSKIQMSMRLLGLGIDSISAIQIASKARRTGLHLTARDIIQSRTVGDLVMRAGAEDESEDRAGQALQTAFQIPRQEWSALTPKVKESDVDSVTVATPGMQWFMGGWQRSGGSRYQHVFGFELSADVDILKLQKAWDELLTRHAILRAAFSSSAQGEPRVVIYKRESMGARWQEEECDDIQDYDEGVASRMRALISSPPSSMQEPLTRATLLRSPSRNALIIHLHHFQYDAWSLQLLLDDLVRLYQGQPPTSSNDHSAILRVAVPDEHTRTEQRSYWQRMLTPNDPTLILFPKIPGHQARSNSSHNFLMKKSVLTPIADLEARARALSVSLYVVYLTCWAQVQAAATSSNSAIFGLWHSGRTGSIDQVECLAAPCLNILPFVVRGFNSTSTMDIATQIQDDLRERTPLVEQSPLTLVDEVMGGTGRPLCNVFVNIVRAAPELHSTQQTIFTPIDVPYFIPEAPSRGKTAMPELKVTGLIQDDIIVDIVDVSERGEVAMSIEFSEDTLDVETAEAMILQWVQLVKECLA
ncbi:siderophore biosynthesis enzyme [Gelatoporia subvermispora B]|nr:siderophore biosynthesis enzyme [Gelatoporia subvermispora B]